MALYPPIVASSMPAFDVNTGKVRIYYTLSNYNSTKKDQIVSVHVSVRRQSSNVNVLKNENQLVEKEFGLQSDQDKVLNRYYVQISNQDLKENQPFKADALYKVQLRFCSGLPSDQNLDFYTSNISYFSQWSTVCIIKPIQVPLFYIDDFYTGQEPRQTDLNNFYYNLADFVGIYKQQKSSQILKYWRLRLLSEGYSAEKKYLLQDFVLCDSGWVLSSARNYNLNDNSLVLSCSLPYELTQDKNYKLLFEIQTHNGYQGSILYNFNCNMQNINALEGQLETYINEEEGYIKVNFTSPEIFMGNLVLRRTDVKSGFLKWEDLKYFNILDTNPSFVYYDFTAQSGTLYRYLVQKVDARGRRSLPIYDFSRETKSGVMGQWSHAFLLQSTGNGEIQGVKQLKLKYDFQISSYKTNISESKTDTIGSKYPFIRRNGNMYYRSFPISGTITQYTDEANLFTNLESLFNGYYDKYKIFKGQIGNYTTQYDYTYERKFREKVQEFLYNSKPKLYKSMQQGNIFIKLMDVSLTPKNELGRLIYSFSATAYQIDQVSIKTFNNYNLIHTGQFNPNISNQVTRLGQITSYDFQNDINGNVFKAGQDIIGAGPDGSLNSIARYIKFMQSFNNKIVTDFNINWLRITIESDPYLIIEQNQRYRPYDDVISDYLANNPKYKDKNIIRNDRIQSILNNEYQDDITDPINYPLYQIESTYNDRNVYLGWLFEINNEQVIISPPNNIYQLNDKSFMFNRNVKIIPAKDTAMLVDFRLINVVEQDLSRVPKNIRINKVNGQIFGTYDFQTEIISRIKYKYSFVYEKEKDRIKKYINGVNSVLVDTEPGAIIELETSEMEENPKTFVVNETGELNFDPNDPTVYIMMLKIIGKQVRYDKNKQIQNSSGDISSLDQIVNPKIGQVITINNKTYYYTQLLKWFEAEKVEKIQQDDQNLINVYHCPVDAMIFYYASLREDIY